MIVAENPKTSHDERLVNLNSGSNFSHVKSQVIFSLDDEILIFFGGGMPYFLVLTVVNRWSGAHSRRARCTPVVPNAAAWRWTMPRGHGVMVDGDGGRLGWRLGVYHGFILAIDGNLASSNLCYLWWLAGVYYENGSFGMILAIPGNFRVNIEVVEELRKAVVTNWCEGIHMHQPRIIGISYIYMYTVYRLAFFPYIGNNNPNWLIFFRVVETTNQYNLFAMVKSWSMIKPMRDGSLRLPGITMAGIGQDHWSLKMDSLIPRMTNLVVHWYPSFDRYPSCCPLFSNLEMESKPFVDGVPVWTWNLPAHNHLNPCFWVVKHVNTLITNM